MRYALINNPTMRKYLFVLTILTLLPFCAIAKEQSNTSNQELVLLYPSGKEVKTDLATIGKLVFTPDSVFLVSYEDERLGQEARGKIQHIHFADKTHSALTTADETGVSIYPNPADNMLTINGIEHPTTVRIYSTNGALQIMEKIYSTNNTLSVASLSKGIYLLQINTQVLRLIKR